MVYNEIKAEKNRPEKGKSRDKKNPSGSVFVRLFFIKRVPPAPQPVWVRGSGGPKKEEDMAVIILPELILDRRFFHSASLRRVDERTKEQAKADSLAGKNIPLESMPLVLQITVEGPKDLHNTIFQGKDENETRNMFAEVLMQLATIDGQQFPDLKNYNESTGSREQVPEGPDSNAN